MEDRLPPNDKNAERGVLGGILRDPPVFHTVREVIGPEAFYHDAHQRIFAVMNDLSVASVPIDLVTIHDRLRRSNQLEDVGGVSYLTELWESVPTGANAEYHAKIILDAAGVRALIHTANEILRDAYDRSVPATELISDAERKIMGIAEKQFSIGRPLLTSFQILQQALARIDQRIAAGGKMMGLATGYGDVDTLLAGLRPGQLNVLAARPSIGKTALALNIARKVALTGAPVLFFSLEMPQVEIADRLMALGSGVPVHKINSGEPLSTDEVSQLTLTASTDGIGGCDIFVDDNHDQSGERMMQITRRAVRKFGIQLVIVDYLQLIRPENSRSNRNEQVGAMSRKMKHIARECGIPMLCLAQLNRDVEKRTDGEPRLCDLRDSGEIEQDADNVVFLHQPDQDKNRLGWEIDAIVAKNRNGPKGKATLLFLRSVMRFENHCKEPERARW